MADETSPRWSEQEVREVSRRVLSMLCRTLEADTLEPGREEPGDPAMRGQGASGEESVGKCTPRGPLPAKGMETTYRGTRSTRGARGRCRRQKRERHDELGTWAQGGSKPIPATEGQQGAGRGLEAQAGPIERDGTPETPAKPRSRGEGRSDDKRRGQDLGTKEAPGRGAPPGHRPPPRPPPRLGCWRGKAVGEMPAMALGGMGVVKSRGPEPPDGS